jgi:hypothetical protein
MLHLVHMSNVKGKVFRCHFVLKGNLIDHVYVHVYVLKDQFYIGFRPVINQSG